MSVDHYMYVGAYVLLDKPLNKEPIVDGTRIFYGCEVHGRKDNDYCDECGSPLGKVTVPNTMDDCIDNVLGEDMTEHPLWIAIHDIGYRLWAETEGNDALIGVNNPLCSIEIPNIDYSGGVTNVRLDEVLSPARAVELVMDEHADALRTMGDYFNVVEVRYGGVHYCG